MKTRIIYPKNIWYNDKFSELSAPNRLLCLYLITNENIGLTRIYQQKDMEIRFIHSLSPAQLEKSKQEIEATGLFYFFEDWVYINNDFSYCDYEGRDRVMDAKEKEMSAIPSHVLTHFEQVIKGLESGYKPPINNKLKTLNPKSKTLNPKSDKPENLMDLVTDEFLTDLQSKYPKVNVRRTWEKLQNYCASKGKRYKDYKAALRNWVINDDEKTASVVKTGGVRRYGEKTN